MSELKTATVSIIKVDWFTYASTREEGKVGLDEYAAQCYELAGRMEIGSRNDADYAVTVDAKPLADYDKPAMREALEHRYIDEYNLHTLMQDMCSKGFLPPGSYLVRVSW